MSIDPRLERSVLAELALRHRCGDRQRSSLEPPRALAERVHRGRHDLLAHVRRVAHVVPETFRSAAWLHHAREAAVTSGALLAAGLTHPELRAIELLAYADLSAPDDMSLARVRTIAAAPGRAGHLARVVARAALEDRLGGRRPDGQSLAALLLLADPQRAR